MTPAVRCGARALRWLVLAALVLTSGCGLVPSAPRPEPSATPDPSPVPTVAGAGGAGGQDIAPHWDEIADRTAPSLVRVLATTGAGTSAATVTGSGVVYSAAGAVLTAAHVVGAAKRVQLGFADGSAAGGTVVAVDPLADLAVVQCDRKGLFPATFAVDVPAPGSPVLLAGGPGSALAEILVGPVAAARPAAATAGRAVTDVLQSGGPVPAVTSGGAVLDARGHVAGLAEAPVPGQPLLGAVLPAPAATVVAARLIGKAAVRHAVLGLRPAAVTLAIAEAFRLQSSGGVLVQDLTPGGPAAKAGVRPGDVLISLGGERLATVSAYLRVLAGAAPSQAVTLTLVRGGVSEDVTVTPGLLAR